MFGVITLLLIGCSERSLAGLTQHDVVTFDYGWRFYLGTPGPTLPPTTPPPTPNCSDVSGTFPVNASGVELLGLQKAKGATPSECAKSCCMLGPYACWVWQFHETLGCWVGDTANKGVNDGWIGASRGNRTLPPSPTPGPPTPFMPVSPPAASPSFDDSTWQLVDLPHDYIVLGEYDPNTPGDQGPGSTPGGAGRSYLPREVAFYRKHFSLPEEWQGSTIWIYFEGVFRATEIFLNGELVRLHAAHPGDASGERGGIGMGGGYTSFSVRLDNASTVFYGSSGTNVLGVYVDPREGSGWFYEGGGIYRKTYLHSAPTVHIDTDGLVVRSNVTSLVNARGPSALGATAAATVSVKADLVNMNTASQASASVRFEVIDSEGSVVGFAESQTVTIAPAPDKSKPSTRPSEWVTMSLAKSELWSVGRPYIYTLRATVNSGDSWNTTFGIHSTRWTGDKGFFLNDEHVKVRGFCDHSSFGGVGMAIPDRVNLYRAQALRSVGGNGWRMSHNPPAPELLDILDRVGVVAMDETRILNSDNTSVMNMGAMVKRDRNHPSVIIYSYCNEAGCGGTGAAQFRNITLMYDTTRPTLGNAENKFMDPYTDVEGFSHSPTSAFTDFNAQFPNRPKFASECCSCGSQRSSTQGTSLEAEQGSLSCTAEQSNRSNALDFMVGTMVWTLFDYYGESGGWPHVSSSYGQIDLAGFLKNTAYWYRAWWLSAVPLGDAGRPVGFGASPTCHAYMARGGLMVITESPTVKLFEDGSLTDTESIPPLETGVLQIQNHGSTNITVVCVDGTGDTAASTTLTPAGNATALEITLDAPNEQLGTGSALVLDGHDVALLRVRVVDTNGTLVDSSANITFTVTAGPGRVLATHNGDPQCHEPNQASWQSAFIGLARGIVQVTEHRVGSLAQRELLASIDKDSAHATVITNASPGPTSITVMASSPGLASASVSIPVSVDKDQHGVLAAATASFNTLQSW